MRDASTTTAEAIEQDYRTRLAQRRAALAARERTHANYGYARLAVFGSAMAILGIVGLDGLNWIPIPFGAFIVLAFAHARVLNARDRAGFAVGFYERGLARLGHQWIGRGRDGRHLAPQNHRYAEDLDIFGRGSLFELLATTRTHAGEETLAAWLLDPAAPEVVKARQAAVRELAPRLDLRERVAVMGDTLKVGVHARLLRQWAATPISLRGPGVRVGIALLVAATISSAVWWLATDHFGIVFALCAVGQLLTAALFKGRVGAVSEAVDEPAHDLDLLADLLRTIETESFTSARLRQIQAAVKGSGRPASVEIARLSQLTALLASRHNVMFAIPAGILMWATQWSFAIEAWRARAGGHIPAWLDAVGEFEALLALATFSAEHPAHVFPDLVAGSAVFAAEDLAHPTLPASAMGNSVALGDRQARLLIVSGSNMSGKSTLLRAVGANAVLAQAGAPVRARVCRISAIDVGAAIRVQDSLTDGQSRFFAEITRLKDVVDLVARRDGAVLFLFDEILGGTNSHDRRIGSEALLAGLVEAGAIGMVTTHDLALGEMADRFAGKALNVHFADRFDAGGLTFDYQLRPGIVRTSNAIALMRSIGLRV